MAVKGSRWMQQWRRRETDELLNTSYHDHGMHETGPSNQETAEQRCSLCVDGSRRLEEKMRL